MTYTIQTLSGLTMTEVYNAFMAAFADYIQDPSGLTEDTFSHRAHNNGVNLDISAGAFVDGALVGFTLVAVGEYGGRTCAYDAGTGIIKAYRGRGIAKAMFDFLVPILTARGVTAFYLEALTENNPAIRAYEKAGFQAARVMDSFALDPKVELPALEPDPLIEVHPLSATDLAAYAGFLDWTPSWESRFASITRITNGVTLLGARYGGERAGILAYYPMLKWILCLAVKPEYRRRGVASQLLGSLVEGLGPRAAVVRMINVDNSDQGMIRFLGKTGFEYAFKQVEMVKELDS